MARFWRLASVSSGLWSRSGSSAGAGERRLVVRVSLALLTVSGLLMSACVLVARSAAPEGVRNMASVLVDPDTQQSSILQVSTVGCHGLQVGSGVVVDFDGEARLLTNRHLVQGAETLAVGGASVALEKLKVSESYDLADIGPGDPFGVAGRSRVVLADEEPQRGDAVVMMGFAGGTRLQAIRASVHLVQDGSAYGFDHEVLMLSLPTRGGFSGGAVLNGAGELVGLLVAVDQVTNLTIAIPSSILVSHLQEDVMNVGPGTCI